MAQTNANAPASLNRMTSGMGFQPLPTAATGSGSGSAAPFQRQLSAAPVYENASNAAAAPIVATPDRIPRVLQLAESLPDDNRPPATTQTDQQNTESVCNRLTAPWIHSPQPFQSIKLKRDDHVFFLLRALGHLSASYTSLDASRPWLVYWSLHSLDLLDALHSAGTSRILDRCVDFLSRCQHPTGGFGGGPGQHPHLAPTYAAVNALCIIGTKTAYQVVNRKTCYEFLLRMKAANGGFHVCDGGEIDTRGTYTMLSVASLLNLVTPTLISGTAEWIARCQTYEGGFGGEPGAEAHGGYSFCGLAGLMILDRTDLIDVPRLLRWASARQMGVEGGFQGRTNKLVDGCYSFWVGSLFPLIDAVLKTSSVPIDGDSKSPTATASASASTSSSSASASSAAASSASGASSASSASPAASSAHASELLFDESLLQRYVLLCCQPSDANGGLRDKPGKNPDLYHTAYCLSGLSLAQNAPFAAATTTSATNATSASASAAPSSHVLGAASNRLNRTHPVYNIRPEHVQPAMTYFWSCDRPTKLLSAGSIVDSESTSAAAVATATATATATTATATAPAFKSASAYVAEMNDGSDDDTST